MTNDNQRLSDNTPVETFDHFEAVREFYTAAGVDPSPELCVSLIREEAREVFEAAENLLKELADLEYVMIGAVVNGLSFEQLGEVNEDIQRVSHLFDLIPPPVLSEAFRRVHLSNMSKLTNGVLVRDEETGKVLKGPNYRKPDLSDLI